MSDLGAVRVYDLLRTARDRAASDVHFGSGERPALRIDGALVSLDATPIDDAATSAFLRGALGPIALKRLDERGTADGAARSADLGPLRVHAFRWLGGLRVVVRILPLRIPQLESLGLPPIVAAFAARSVGLVLFAGPTGSGKTTALAALIDRINRSAERNILTVEDPVEMIHAPARSLVTHCEVGRDVSDFAEALRGFMRADPDVILIGELRDRETMEAAITAAETGHLVFATLHTNDAPQTVDRIIDAFPAEAQTQVRSQLASCLTAVCAMRLVRRRSGGRTAAVEILIGSDAVRAMIRDAKTHQIRNAIATGRNVGMQTLEAHLSDMVRRGEVDLDAALAVANRPAEVRSADRPAAVV